MLKIVETKEMKPNSAKRLLKKAFLRKALALALVLASVAMPFASIPVNPANQAYADEAQMGQIIAFNTAGQHTWTAPSNVTSVQITAWGAGGAGGNGIKNSSDNSAGQGGGAGGYAQGQISITPGSTHTITVGAGGSSTGGDRNGGASSFDSSVAASGGIGGANWDEIPNNHGNGGSNPDPVGIDTACDFEGTWVYHDEGGNSNGNDANDFAVTCRDSKLTGFCNVGLGMFAGMLSRGLHVGNYICEQGVTPEIGTKCDFDGTWSYNDEGSGNDLAFTCRTGKVTGYCGSTNLPRGINPGVYTCEYGQPTTTDAPACNFSGAWEYNDEGSGNDFALICENNKMTTWCGTTNLNRGLNSGVFSCQTPLNIQENGNNNDAGGWTKNLDIFDGVNHLIRNTLEFIKPATAYAQTVFNGQGGNGTAGTDLRSGESASQISFVNGMPYASSGGAAHEGGAGGSRGRLGKDGAGDCVGFTCDLARNGAQPGGGGGGSDTGYGGNGGDGYVLIKIMGIQFPDSDLPTDGHLDSADCNVISGWAFDPNASSTSIDVFIYTGSSLADGDFLATVTTDQPRPDVNSFKGITGNHGFIFPTPDSLKDGGTHQIFAYGVNTDPSHSYNNAQLHSPAPVYVSGCTGGGGPVNPTNTAPTAPVINGPTSGVTGVDYTYTFTSTDPDGDQVRFAFDWNNDGGIEEYTVLGNSGSTASFVRNYPVGGNHLFHVYAEDNHGNRSSASSYTTTIVEAPVTPGDARPVGVLDSASCSVISGWTYDPDTSSISNDVHFYVGGPAGTGVFLGSSTANQSRPDVNTAEGITGNHGFTFTTPDSLKDNGTHEIYAYGISTNPSHPDNNGLLAAIGPIVVTGCTVGGPGGDNQTPTGITITGPVTGSVNTSYAFTANATDPNGHSIQYGFDWDNSGAIDGSEEWTPTTISGISATRSNIWTTSGLKTFQVLVRDSFGAQGSASHSINISGGGNPSNMSFTVAPLTGLTTSEAGATSPFTVVLNSAPLADVAFTITSSDWTEGTTSVSSLLFTPSNWNVSQTVIVTGVDDGAVDGTVAYTIQVGPTTSVDINFNNLAAQNVAVSNFDNEVPPTTGGGSSGGGGGGGGGGGSGYGAGGTCIGFNCSSGTGGSGTTLGDTIIILDTPSSGGGSTGPFAQDYCPADELITVYLRKDITNDVNEVRKLQYFLNTYAGANLPIDGIFGTSTEDAVKAFQLANSDAVLAPWGVTEATGIVYITTTNAINRIFCAANPSYTGNNDLKDILDGNVLDVPTNNSGQFDGVIGANTDQNATSTNIAGLFGAITEDIMRLLKDIPWYSILIALLTIIGSGIVINNVFKKDVLTKAGQMSLMDGIVTLSLASVLNVLNALSFMIDPVWLTNHSGLTISVFLGLVILNLLALIAVAISVAVAIRRRVSSSI